MLLIRPIAAWIRALCRSRCIAAAVLATAMMMSGWGGAGTAFAGPACPGPTTSDGSACCAPGSTPDNANDTCMLPNGTGQAASCALTQLTTSGTCCPLSSTPQSDGTCLSANGNTVQSCALGQLTKSGFSCCPTGQTPQADGSCKAAQTTATPGEEISACPPGYSYVLATGDASTSIGACAAPLTAAACPTGTQPLLSGQLSYGCCPGGSQPTVLYDNNPECVAQTVQSNGTVTEIVVSSVAPTCPPETSLNLTLQTQQFYCTVPPKCSSFFVLDWFGGRCLTRFSLGRLNLSLLLPKGSAAHMCRPGLVPREAFVGDAVCVMPAAHDQTKTDNVAAPTHTKPDGTCMPGYVWREASADDRVCVPPTTRKQIWSDNRQQCDGDFHCGRQVVTPTNIGPPLGHWSRGTTRQIFRPGTRSRGRTVQTTMHATTHTSHPSVFHGRRGR